MSTTDWRDPRPLDDWPLEPLTNWWRNPDLPWACKIHGHDWSPMWRLEWKCRICGITDQGGSCGRDCMSPPGRRGAFTRPRRAQ